MESRDLDKQNEIYGTYANLLVLWGKKLESKTRTQNRRHQQHKWLIQISSNPFVEVPYFDFGNKNEKKERRRRRRRRGRRRKKEEEEEEEEKEEEEEEEEEEGGGKTHLAM